MKTAVVYARYSSDRQTEQSIEGQLRVCQDYAERNDILILDTYIDKAMTGTNDERDAFQKMMADSDNKSWDCVLVYKLDRFCRNKYEKAIHKHHLEQNGIKLISVMENIPDTPEGTLLESVIEGINQYYSEELSQKTKRGMNETRLKGNFIGGFVNYGYERDGMKLKINPDEAEILKQIFNDYANGKKVSEIARELNNKGLKNKGMPFYSSTVYCFLKQEKYTGIYRLYGKEYDKIYPPIIDKDTFALVKKRIEENRHGRHKDDAHYSLKGKAFCGYCGKPLASYTGTSCKGELLRYYKCRSIKEKTGCENKAIGKELFENIINKAVLKVLDKKSNMELLADKILEIHTKRCNSDTSLNLIKADLDATNKAIANVMSAIEKGIFTETTKNRLEELEKQKRELEEKVIIAKSKEKLILTKENIINYFKHSISQAPQIMIDLLIKNVYVYQDKIEITFNYTKTEEEQHEKQIFTLFTETYSMKKGVKGGSKKTYTHKIDIFILI